MSIPEKTALSVEPLSDLLGVASVGVFGGTFDPIHTGHLILAERAREELDLNAILFMPANIPPHKITGRNIVPGQARLDMIQLAIDANAGFYATSIELSREGVSYTVDTLRELRTALPEAHFTLLIGSDNAREFSSWHHPEEIVSLAQVGVWERPGSSFGAEILPNYIARTINSPLLEISSTEIRNRIAAGQSIRYLTPDPVIDYIMHHGIYR